MKLVLFFISDISYIFLMCNTFFAFSLHHLESQFDTYATGHRAYEDIWTLEIGESLDTQVQPKNPIEK